MHHLPERVGRSSTCKRSTMRVPNSQSCMSLPHRAVCKVFTFESATGSVPGLSQEILFYPRRMEAILCHPTVQRMNSLFVSARQNGENVGFRVPLDLRNIAGSVHCANAGVNLRSNAGQRRCPARPPLSRRGRVPRARPPQSINTYPCVGL